MIKEIGEYHIDLTKVTYTKSVSESAYWVAFIGGGEILLNEVDHMKKEEFAILWKSVVDPNFLKEESADELKTIRKSLGIWVDELEEFISRKAVKSTEKLEVTKYQLNTLNGLEYTSVNGLFSLAASGIAESSGTPIGSLARAAQVNTYREIIERIARLRSWKEPKKHLDST